LGLFDHIKHRLNPKTVAKEALAGLTDKIIPQGADELGNVLFSGNAYLPWPGKGHLPPVPEPEAPAEMSYTQQLEQAAGHGDSDRDRGRSR